MAFEGEITAAIGKRVSIRLLEKLGGNESYRDILGVLQDETTVVKRDGSTAKFDSADIAFFRVVPVFNRRDLQSGEVKLYDTRNRQVEEIAAPGSTVTIYCWTNRLSGCSCRQYAHISFSRSCSARS
jgi:cysteinyl-tRNA synthetase